MASHLPTKQIYKDYLKILIYIFAFVWTSHAQRYTQFTRCWLFANNAQYVGARHHGYASTNEECIEECEKMRYCHVIHFIPSNTWPCFYVTEVLDERKFGNGDGQLYREDMDCLLGSCWTKIPTRFYSAFYNMKQERSVVTCADRCLRLKVGCLHISYRHGARYPCWMDTHNRDYVHWKNDPGVTSYSADRQCWVTSAPRFNRTSKPVPEIPNCWYRMEFIKYQGLTHSSETTFQGCVEICQNDRNCLVISWQEGHRWPCHYSKSSIDIQNFEDNTAYDSFVIEADCTIKSWDVCWKKTKDFVYRDLDLYKNEQSVLACMDWCKHSKCTMVTYHHGTKEPCYLGYQIGVQNPPGESRVNVDSYILCANTGPPRTFKPRPTPAKPSPSTAKPSPTPAKPSPTPAKPRPSTDIPRPSTDIPIPSTDIPTPSTDIPTPSTDLPTPSTVRPTTHPTTSPVFSVASDTEYDPGNETYPYYEYDAASKTFLSLYCCIIPLVLLAGPLLNTCIALMMDPVISLTTTMLEKWIKLMKD